MWSLLWMPCLVWRLAVAQARQVEHRAVAPILPPKPFVPRAAFGNISTANSSLQPNPCINSDFRAPEYELDDLAIYANLREPPRDRFTKAWSYATFKLRDVANNYTLACSMDSYYVGDDWSTDACVPETGHLPKYSRALNFLNGMDPKGNSSVGTLRLAQYWYCDIANGSYPQLYQARAEMHLDVTCTWHGETEAYYPCTIVTAMPFRFKPQQWQPTGPLPMTPELIPRPSPPPAHASGIHSPPARDCTEVSFSNPNWAITKFTLDDRSLGLSITSRATGNTVICSGEVGNSSVSSAITCPPTDDYLHSQSTFAVQYDGTTFNITQSWVCGDSKGLHSTNFTATGTCAKGDNDSMMVRGRLVSPVNLLPAPIPMPPGASTPGCLAKSQEQWYKTWTISKFLYQTTQQSILNNWPIINTIPLRPWNRTLQLELHNNIINVTQSCALSDVALDNTTDQWFPCFTAPDLHSIAQRTIQTYIQLTKEPRRMTLLINQTWYCNDINDTSPFQVTGHAAVNSPSIFCGSGNNTAYDVLCAVVGGFMPVYCDVLFTAQWCTLSNRDGYGPPLSITSTNTSITALPANALTPYPDPLPETHSCTVASLGRPIIWTLSQPRSYFSLSRWFGAWRSDQMPTTIAFDLLTSIFPSTPIHSIGISISFGPEPAAFTPWIHGYDPSLAYSNRDANYWTMYHGWDSSVYNILGWKFRLDLSKAYLELNHSWYCDDKDPGNPIVFKGMWGGFLPLRCAYRFGGEVKDGNGSVVDGDGGDGIVCELEVGEFEVVPEVTHEVVNAPVPEGYYYL